MDGLYVMHKNIPEFSRRHMVCIYIANRWYVNEDERNIKNQDKLHISLDKVLRTIVSLGQK